MNEARVIDNLIAAAQFSLRLNPTTGRLVKKALEELLRANPDADVMTLGTLAGIKTGLDITFESMGTKLGDVSKLTPDEIINL